MMDFTRGHRRGALVALIALAVALGVRAALDRVGTAGGGDGGQAQVQSQPTGADAGGDAEPGAGDDEVAIVPESERVAPEGTERVVYPRLIAGPDARAAARYARGLLDASPRPCEAAYANEDGTVDVWQTREQAEDVSRRAGDALDSLRADLASKGVSLEVSDDHRSVTLTAGDGATAQDLALGIGPAVNAASTLQVEETGGEGFALSVDIVDGATGRVMGHADQDTYLGWNADLSWLGGGDAS